MKLICASTILFALTAMPLAAIADRDKDEGGHGKHRHGRSEYKHEYWDGNCKVEIKQKNGHYKEERKCKGHQHVHAAPVHVVPQPVVVVPQPVYVPPPAVVVQPGVVIQGTIHVK